MRRDTVHQARMRPASGLIHTATLLAALSTIAGPSTGQIKAADACRTSVLYGVVWLSGQDFANDTARRVAQEYCNPDARMAELREAVGKLGIALEERQAPLAELPGIRGLKVLRLTSPVELVVALGVSEPWVQVVPDGLMELMAWTELERRYSGEALVVRTDQPAEGPILQWDEWVADAGSTLHLSELDQAFRLTNAGDGPLVVKPETNACCGAPRLTVESTTIPPGESTEVRFSMTANHSGERTESLALVTNDPLQPLACVTVRAHVPHEPKVYPTTLEVSSNGASSPSPWVRVSGPPEMEILDVRTAKGLLDIEVGESELTDRGRREWKIVLRPRLEAIAGRVEDELTVETNHARRKTIAVPVKLEIPTALQTAPLSAFFGFVPRGQPASREAAVWPSDPEHEFEIVAVETDTKGISASASRTDAGYVVTVSVETEVPGVVEGEVVLRTSLPGQRALRVPVYAHVLG